ncbi:MAG: riboflavin synthase [Panacagrimonas sp.]
MFTGIIEACGSIAKVVSKGGDKQLWIRAPDGYLQTSALGDSIAVNGVCLTATAFEGAGFAADVSIETLQATTADGWRAGDAVNLEKALTLSRALGGHLVSGHVDGLAILREMSEDARSRRLQFEAPPALARYIAVKGSVTLDGISLTVNEVSGARFGVNIVPHTLENTNLGQLRPGGQVNLEVDQVARYLERLLTEQNKI